MPKLRVSAYSVSLDGFGAGPNQSLDQPMGERGMELHTWIFATATGHAMMGKPGGERAIDDGFASRAMENLGAWILGRNMFSPYRGPHDDAWRGWWGETPPYHCSVFVLTHHARAPLVMQGGTTFHFVTDGPAAALARAREAAGARDIRVGGGAATIRQYLQLRAIDELHLAYAPVLLGRGESLFADLDWRALGYACTAVVQGERATHVTIQRLAT